MLQEGERRRKREKPTIFSAAGFNFLNFHLSIKKRKKTPGVQNHRENGRLFTETEQILSKDNRAA